MIAFTIEDYCENCPYFEPKSSGPYYYDEDGNTVRKDQSVICEHKKMCAYAVEMYEKMTQTDIGIQYKEM